MTHSVLVAALQKKDLPEAEFFTFLASLCGTAFDPLLKLYSGRGVAKIVAMYVLHAYSPDSALIVAGRDWASNKQSIAEEVGIPDHMILSVITFQEEALGNVVSRYLNLQGEREFKHLMLKKETYENLMDGTLTMSKGDNGKVDLKELRETNKACDELLEEISALEAQMADKHKHILDGLKEVNNTQSRKPVRQSAAVEHNPEIQ
jgi:hypothetical protein